MLTTNFPRNGSQQLCTVADKKNSTKKMILRYKNQKWYRDYGLVELPCRALVLAYEPIQPRERVKPYRELHIRPMSRFVSHWLEVGDEITIFYADLVYTTSEVRNYYVSDEITIIETKNSIYKRVQGI